MISPLWPGGYAPTTKRLRLALDRQCPVPTGRSRTSPAAALICSPPSPPMTSSTLPGGDPENLMSRRVIVVEVVNAIAPLRWPAIRIEPLFHRRSQFGDAGAESASVEHDGQGGVIGHEAAGVGPEQNQLCHLHHSIFRSMRDKPSEGNRHGPARFLTARRQGETDCREEQDRDNKQGIQGQRRSCKEIAQRTHPNALGLSPTMDGSEATARAVAAAMTTPFRRPAPSRHSRGSNCRRPVKSGRR